MPDGGALEFLAAEAIEDFAAVAAAVAAYSTYIEVALVLAAAYQSYEAGVRARDAYNASLRDRYVMQRTATGQRALVLGRARVSGPVAFMQSYGTNQTTLAMVVVLAAHECDAIEKVYFNDTELVIDSIGNVVGVVNTEHFSVSSSTPLTVFLAQAAQVATIVATATYADATITLTTSLASDSLHLTLSGARASGVADVKVTYQPQVCQYTPGQLLDQQTTQTAAAATGSYTFPNMVGSQQNYPGYKYSYFTVGGTVATSVVVVQTVGGKQTALASTCAINSSGIATSVSWSGATVGAQITITYQAGIQASRARVRKYLGAAGQAADATLVANLPGEWTTAHVGNGLCYLVCEFDYDPSSFPSGVPNVSAVVRGAKLLDPRSGTTTWTENPAVLARGYWTHPLGANQPSTMVDDTAVMAAANVCDGTTAYALTIFGVPLFVRTAPLYTAGYVATKDQKPQDVLNDLCMAMGGRWVISGNVLRVKAGAYTSPVAAIDNSWLTGESGVTLQPLPARQSLFNSAQGSFCDETNDYRAVLYPKQISTALVTSDGRELPLDLTYQAVTKTAQAQYLTACAIRYNRAGMTVRLACNMRAFPLEVFDVVTLTLPRFGFVAQAFEVTDTAFTPEGLVQITLKYIDPSIYALDSSYQLTAYAPKTTVPSPWNVGIPVLGTPQTGPSTALFQADGTVVSRIYVGFTINDSSVSSSGYVDVAYIDAGDTSGNWSMVTVSGSSQGAYLAPVKDGHTYLIKARGRNTLFSSPWSGAISCVVVGSTASPSAVAGLTYSNSGGDVNFSWTPNADADYKQTVIQYGPAGTTGNTWGASNMTQAFAGAASSYRWPSPGVAVYEFQFRHYNWSGNATASSTISVSAPDRMEHILSGAASTATWSGVTGTGKPSDNATTDVVLVARGNCVLTGNTGTKVGGSGQWDSDIYSQDSYTGGAYASAVTTSTAQAVMFGLNSDPTTDESYTSLDYAWYLTAGGTLAIYESNAQVLSGIPYAVGDVLVVLYDGVHVSYYQNGALGRVVSAPAGLQLFWDSSFFTPGASLNNIRFGPQTSIGGITMSANGTLAGAGGGAVTISGLGTTGAVGSGNTFPNGDFLASSGGVPVNAHVYNNAGIPVTSALISGGAVGTSNEWQLTAGAAGATQYGMYIDAAPFGGFKANTNYVVSFYAAANGAMAGTTFYYAANHSPATSTWLQNPPLANGAWQRYVILLNWGTNTVDPNVFFSVSHAPNSGDLLDFSCVQVEQGDAPSGWAPVSYLDGSGALQGVQGGAGTTVANSLLTAPIAAAAQTAIWGSVSSTPANLSALSGSETIQNGLISINGSGALGGIGTGSGTTVANSLLTAPIAAAAQTAIWGGVSSGPANVFALSGTETIQNGQITIDLYGTLQGIGSGAGTAVSNSLLTATIADKLSSSAGGVLASTISLGATAGAGFVAGTLTWNSSGIRTGGYGVAMTPGGLVGYNSAGNPTFSISATTGAAFFGGTLAAGTATSGAFSGSASTAHSSSSSASQVFAGPWTLLSAATNGKDCLVTYNVFVTTMTNTNTPVQIVFLPRIDGAAYYLGGVAPQFEGPMTQSNPTVLSVGSGATPYNWGLTVSFSVTFVVPAASLAAGTHTFEAVCSANYFTASGGPNTITGCSIYATGVVTIREFLA